MVSNAMSYGLQLFDSSGQLILDSRNVSDMLIVHDYGVLSIPSIPYLVDYPIFYYQTFKPTTKLPRLYVPNHPYVRVTRPATSTRDWTVHLYVGPFERNSNGEFYRFSLAADVGGFTDRFPDHYPPPPWNIPWVIFVVP